MENKKVKIIWPNGKTTICLTGDDWFKASYDANINIPSGCLGGSCGACEIEANGEVIRTCINKIPENIDIIKVEFPSDPYW